MRRDIVKLISQLGYRVEVLREKRHIIARVINPETGESMVVTISKTPSDARGHKNTLSILKRKLPLRSERHA